MTYPFDGLWAIDPLNPTNVAQNAEITIYAVGDSSRTPLDLTDNGGSPTPNPVYTNEDGFVGSFRAAVPRVAWSGGNATGSITSWEGLKEDVEASAQAAQEAVGAAESAGATAVQQVEGELTSYRDAVATSASDANAAASAAASAAGLVNAPAGEAVKTAISAEGAANAALGSEIVEKAALLRPGINLDIWPGMNPIPATYTNWIAGIDAELGGVGTKSSIGTDSGGGTIHLYDAGDGRKTVLLVSGQHPWEVLGAIAARQFFIQFATSDHPAMQMLRKQIRVLWIPSAISSDFRGGRENANGVNTNRNYPWNWARTSGTDKGAAPLDQPETQAIKSVIDNYPVGLLFDCHNFGGDSSMDMAYATASNMIQGKVLTMEKARLAWESANPDSPEPTQYNTAGQYTPALINWAEKYMRYDLKRQNAMTVLFECISTLGGSDSNGNVMTRDAARWYSSFVYQTVLTWLESGQVDEPVPNFLWLGTHNLSGGGYSDPIETGGRRIGNTDWKTLQMSWVSNGYNQNYVSVPIRHPGFYKITASIHLTAVDRAAGDAPVQIEGGISFTDRAGTNVGPASNSVRTAGMDGNQVRDTLTLNWVTLLTTIPDEAIYEAQLWLRTRTAGYEAVIPTGAGVQLTIEPTWVGEPNYQPLS